MVQVYIIQFLTLPPIYSPCVRSSEILTGNVQARSQGVGAVAPQKRGEKGGAKKKGK